MGLFLSACPHASCRLGLGGREGTAALFGRTPGWCGCCCVDEVGEGARIEERGWRGYWIDSLRRCASAALALLDLTWFRHSLMPVRLLHSHHSAPTFSTGMLCAQPGRAATYAFISSPYPSLATLTTCYGCSPRLILVLLIISLFSSSYPHAPALPHSQSHLTLALALAPPLDPALSPPRAPPLTPAASSSANKPGPASTSSPPSSPSRTGTRIAASKPRSRGRGRS